LYLEDAIAEGKKQNKPVMIDFTGWACVNCRKMEENVWPKPEVYNTLKDNYIIASLYVDEQIALPADQQFESPFLKTRAVTVGDKWFDLSLRHFSNAGQPFYALIDPINSRILNTPKAYTPEVNKYSEFLNCGLTNFKQLHP
jgi:thiol:disulfide interchange protein DsbD